MRLNDIKTIEQFAEYIITDVYENEYKDYQEWCDAVENVVARLDNGSDNAGVIRLYRWQTEANIKDNGYGMHWCNEPEDMLTEPNLVMEFDTALPHLWFWNNVDGLYEFIVPPSSLAKCEIKHLKYLPF